MEFKPQEQDEKTQVSGTNDYSIQSKFSLVRKGYIEDEYLVHFVANPNVSRSPIINWGYYVRHCAIQFGLEWIQNLPKNPEYKNVMVSFGAGFDTLALRNRQLPFIELDYTSVCLRKAKIMIQNGLFTEKEYSFYPDRKSGIIFATSSFVLVGVDLRNCDDLKRVLEESKASFVSLIDGLYSSGSLHRFVFLNECALCYIDGDEGTRALKTVKSFLEQFSSSPKIVYLAYEMYENSLLMNGYTRFMKNHFREIGADILHFPTRSQIEDRSKILELEKCQVFSARNLKDMLASGDNESFRSRFELEPFDEWEDLDAVTMSYELTIAHNEEQKVIKNKQYNDSLTKITQNVGEYSSNSSFQLSVFDHSTIFHNDSVILFGGFGMEPQESSVVTGDNYDNKKKKPDKKIAHRRFQNILELKLNDRSDGFSQVNVIRGESKDSVINRQHCKVEYLCSYGKTNRYLLSGGRTSPQAIQDNVIVDISEDPCDSGSQIFRLDRDNEFSQGGVRSSRHAFSLLATGNNDYYIHFGGFEDMIMGNFLWQYNAGRDLWDISELKFGDCFTRRFSMAITPFSAGRGAISHGGLIGSFIPKSVDYSGELYTKFDLIDTRESTVHHFEIPGLESRYGHQIVPDPSSECRFWIVGGTGEKSVQNNALLVDLLSRKVVQEVSLNTPNQNTFLLQKFSCHSLNNGNLLTLGGGGNCFSFGTSFNSSEFFSEI